MATTMSRSESLSRLPKSGALSHQNSPSQPGPVTHCVTEQSRLAQRRQTGKKVGILCCILLNSNILNIWSRRSVCCQHWLSPGLGTALSRYSLHSAHDLLAASVKKECMNTVSKWGARSVSSRMKRR